MRALALSALLVLAGALSNPCLITAQQLSTAPDCRASSDPPTPDIQIDKVTFTGSLHLSPADLDAIASSIKQNTRGGSLENVVDEALNRARFGWQNAGYFTAQVTGEALSLPEGQNSKRLALSLHVIEGARYTLKGISFKNNRAIWNQRALRGAFHIDDGEVFDRSKIAAGLETLRKLYGNLGFINFTSVPGTTIDEASRTIALQIDINEGKQFYVRDINILGVSEPARTALLDWFPLKSGEVYNTHLWAMSLQELDRRFPNCTCGELNPPPLPFISQHLDEKSATATFTVDLRSCTRNPLASRYIRHLKFKQSSA